MLIYFNWTDVWPSELHIGKISLHAFAYDGATPEQENFTLEVYNGTNWNPRMDIRIQSTSGALPFNIDYYILDTNEMTDGKVYSRLVDTVPGTYSDHTDINASEVYVDYIALTPYEDRWSDEIEDLERRIRELEKQIHSDNPVSINETELPYVSFGNRGLDDNVQFVDPYRTIEFTTRVSGSGSDLSFYLPYPSAEEVTVMSDEIWIAPVSYTRLWINDTVGASELVNVSTDLTYYNVEWGYNITVQTSGASSTVRADRVTVVQLTDSFNWGWNRDSGLFAHTSTIENEIAYDMEVVRCYWAFPDEDADGRDIQIDVASIEVWDDDNNLQLDKGRHYEATEAGGVYLQYRWVNTSGTSAIRTVRIQFTRASLTQGEAYYTIYDGQIAYSDTYGDAPYVANVHHTQHGTANFEGKIIIKFSLSGQYSGEKIDVRSLRIKRSDTSLTQQYTYDSISNELRITDQSVGAGESITYTLYWDWYTEKGAIVNLFLGDPLILYSLLLLAGFSGLFIFLDATKEEKRRKYAGLIIIGIDVAILVIILVAG